MKIKFKIHFNLALEKAKWLNAVVGQLSKYVLLKISLYPGTYIPLLMSSPLERVYEHHYCWEASLVGLKLALVSYKLVKTECAKLKLPAIFLKVVKLITVFSTSITFVLSGQGCLLCSLTSHLWTPLPYRMVWCIFIAQVDNLCEHSSKGWGAENSVS